MLRIKTKGQAISTTWKVASKVTTKGEPGVGPRWPKPLAHTLEYRQHWGTAEALGLEDCGDQTPREAFIQVAWQETIATIIAIVADMFLCTMSAVLGVIDSEMTSGGRL